MNNTPALSLSQVLDLMEATMRIQGRTMAENPDAVPEMDRYHLCRLGSEMWQRITALRAVTLAQEAAQADAAYLVFRGKLLSKPKRARRAKKQVA